MRRATQRGLCCSGLSLLIPGLGQIWSGKGERGATILIAAIIVGNLNVIWLALFSKTHSPSGTFWGYTLPKALHRLFAVWGLVFLAWQVIDAYEQGAGMWD